MFDLQKALESWRNSLPLELLQHPQRADELEQHLHDAFDQRISAGDPPQVAWTTALDSLGPPASISSEFTKLDQRPWLPNWLAGFGMALIAAGMILFIGLRFRGRPLLAAHVLIITIAYCSVFAVGFLAAVATVVRALKGWDDCRHSFRVAAARLSALAFFASIPGILLGALWAHDHLGGWWAWDSREIGGLCVLAWSAILLKCFSTRTIPPQLLMLLGIIGNIVVAISWFGPSTASTHGYGFRPSLIGALLSAFVILQMVLVYLALLPDAALRMDRLRRSAQ
jgi:hypothetical protein